MWMWITEHQKWLSSRFSSEFGTSTYRTLNTKQSQFKLQKCAEKPQHMLKNHGYSFVIKLSCGHNGTFSLEEDWNVNNNLVRTGL